jgi:hypothetical protein
MAISALSRLDKRGVSRSSRTRGGMWWTRQRQARKVVRRAVIRERAQRARRRRCSVRQNRVVLASVAGVKLPVANLIQPDRRAIKPAGMEARRIRLQGERGISRQTIAQGMPECSGCTCMLVCATLYTIAHETAGAASTRHSLLPPFSKEGTSSCKPRAQCAARMQCRICVGWVERSNTHQPCAGLDGYCFAPPIRRTTNRPSLRAQRSNPSFRARGDNGLLRFARNDVEGPQRTEYPTYAGYEDSLAPRKLRQARQRKPGFTDASHAHVKKLFRVQIDND